MRALLIIGGLATLYVAGMFGRLAWRYTTGIRRFRRAYGPQGKDLLLVYSESPHWQRYVEQRWLPRWGSRAVVLNWSDRAEWSAADTPEAALFRSVAGDREFNPLAVVVPRRGRIRVVRFWRAFRDYKHGKDRALRDAERELEEALRSPPGQ